MNKAKVLKLVRSYLRAGAALVAAGLIVYLTRWNPILAGVLGTTMAPLLLWIDKSEKAVGLGSVDAAKLVDLEVKAATPVLDKVVASVEAVATPAVLEVPVVDTPVTP